jgi:hypothetical protein
MTKCIRARPEFVGPHFFILVVWSPAVVCVIIGGVLMMIAAMAVGWGFHLKPGIPPSGTCSAVVAAAYHVDPTETREGPMELHPLKWGVISPRQVATVITEGNGSYGYASAVKPGPGVRISALAFPSPFSPSYTLYEQVLPAPSPEYAPP